MRQTLNLLAILFSLVAYSQNTIAEHHFESSEVNQVIIEGIFCDIYATGGGDKVIFDGIIKGNGDRGDYVIASIRNGSTVIFKVEKKSGKNWGWNDINQSRITLDIPDNVSLKIENTSGDIEVRNYVNSSLEIQATSGDINLRQIKADCKLRTTSGDLQVRGAEGDIRMVSTSGDQEYFGIVGDVSATATSGEIILNKIEGYLKLVATSGDIEMDGITGGVKAQTTSGEIEGEDVRLTDNSTFRTTSGDTYIALENELKELSFQLNASSGDLRVGGIRGEDELRIEKGPIRIEGISTSGDQTYKN